MHSFCMHLKQSNTGTQRAQRVLQAVSKTWEMSLYSLVLFLYLNVSWREDFACYKRGGERGRVGRGKERERKEGRKNKGGGSQGNEKKEEDE